MPNPETGFDQDLPSNPLWTFDTLGNLNLAGQVTVGGLPALNRRTVLPGVPVGGSPGAAVGPSGDPSGATDYATIQKALNANAGSTVALGPGKYWTNAPLTIPPYTALVGPANTTQVSQVDGGAVIAPAPGFTPLTITDSGSVVLSSVILLLSQPFGGYATVSEEQKVSGIMIDGSTGPASVHGILSYGKVQRVQMDRTLVSTVTGDGIKHLLDHAGNQPDAWTCFKVFSRFVGGIGFNIRAADSTWMACVQSNSTGIGWFINTTSNSKYIGCRSEHAGTLGWGYVCVNSAAASGGVAFVGCSTDQSQQFGFQAGGTINSVASISSATPLLFSGCNFRRDGANAGSGGGSYSGLYVNGYGGQVTIDGLSIFPGVNDDGTGSNAPQIGMTIASSSKVNISGAYVQGATTAISDDGSNTVNSVNVTPATGTTASPVIGTPVLSAGGNALAQVQPATQGLLAWTYDPAQAGGNLTMTNGAQYLQAIYPSRTKAITSIWFYVSTAPGTATASENFVGIVDSTGALLQSADATTAFGTTGLKQVTISSQLLTAGQLYWVVALANCSGSPSTVTIRATSLSNIALANVGLTAATARFTGCGLTKTDLTNFPVTPSSNAVVASQQPAWFAVS